MAKRPWNTWEGAYVLILASMILIFRDRGVLGSLVLFCGAPVSFLYMPVWMGKMELLGAYATIPKVGFTVAHILAAVMVPITNVFFWQRLLQIGGRQVLLCVVVGCTVLYLLGFAEIHVASERVSVGSEGCRGYEEYVVARRVAVPGCREYSGSLKTWSWTWIPREKSSTNVIGRLVNVYCGYGFWRKRCFWADPFGVVGQGVAE